MKRRKKNLLCKTMAVLLSAILFIGELAANMPDTVMAAEWGTVSGNGDIVSPVEPDAATENSDMASPVEPDTVSGNDSTVMSKPVITGWKFPEDAVSPQGDLFYENGLYSLLLPGGDSEIQIPMEDIVSLLPESVTVEWTCPATVSEDGQGADATAGDMETGEKELTVAGWSCPEYTEDGEGILPYSGSFFFQAQLCEEEEFALAEDVAQIGAQVIFDAPMTLAVTAQPGRITSDQEWGAQTLQAGTYTIDPGVTVTVTGKLTVGGTVTINGGGTLARGYAGTNSGNGSNHCLLYVTGGNLTLKEICIDGKSMTAYGPAIYIDSGTVNLESGSAVQNNKNMNTGGTAGTYAGGGIYCGGTLNINGGCIRNNCTEASVGSYVYTHSGGAVYLKGTCSMTSGNITGNTAANGGGIYLASTGATLNLSGGTIKDNHANGNGDGIFYSTYNSATSTLRIGGNTNVADVIYLDNTTGSLCPAITSELKYPIRLACSSQEEGKVLAKGSGYTLTGVDASKVSMVGTSLFSKLDKANNSIILSATEEAEATWQEMSGGEWKTGKFTTALEKVYNGGTIKLLTDILLTQKAEITKQITITSNDPAAPCTMTRMPEGDWGNITLTGSGAVLKLTNIIYDGNSAFLSGNENAITQSLIKVGSSSDAAPILTLDSGCVIRNGYKSGGSGVIAVYGTLIAESGSLIENCEVTGTGGAVWIHTAGKANLRGVTIQNCRAGDGGSALSIDGICTLESGTFKNNQDSSTKNCVIYLRGSGTGNLTITGSAQISGGTNSIYNEGKTVKISGKERLSGNIYTTNALLGYGSSVDANMNGNPHCIYWGGTLANGTVVVRNCTNSTACTLANDGYALSAESGNLVMRQTWQITYVKNSGAIAEESNYTRYVAGTGLTLPIPTRTGYSFGGWFTNSAFTAGRTTAVSGSETGNKTFYAKWIQNHRCSAMGIQKEYAVFPMMTGGTLQAGNYFLDRDVDLTTAITVSGTVNLCLNGHQIRQTGDGERIFTIGSGATLNLCDCNGSHGSHTITSLVTGKSVTVSGGLLTGGRSNGLGGAVLVDTGGTFYLYGGTLAANTSRGSGGHGGAVRTNGTFYLCGGEISHNKTGCGGGVCICDGETKILGGRIAYNESTDDGGGVFFESGSNRFSMIGGEIVNNRAVSCGGGVHYYTGVMEVSGSAVIKDNYIVKNGVQETDNVYLDTGRVLFAGQLTSGAHIGVSTQSVPGESPVPVAGAGSGKYAGYFFSDNALYNIVNQDNTVKLVRDTQAPTGTITVETNKWSTLLGKVTFGLFFKETKKVTIAATDDISGVDSVCYFLSPKALTESEVKSISGWTKGTEFTISPDRVCVIYAKLTDRQGNISYLSSDGMVFDGTAPVITGVTDGKIYCISAQAKVTDNYLSSVTVNGKSVTPDAQGGIVLTAVDGSQTIVATDRAGNRTELTVTVQAEHSYGNWRITKEPTFTAAGIAERVCSVDNSHIDTQILSSLSDKSVWTAEMKTVPTDTGKGTMEYTSTEYGKVTVEIPALTDEDAWEKGNYAPPTENAPGSQEYTSEEYGTVTVEIPAFSDTDIWTMEMNPAPSEDAPGVMEYTSERYETVTVEIPKLTDTGVWTAEMKSEPTKDTQGTMEYTSKYGTVSVQIPALTDTDTWTGKVTEKPTEDKPGVREYTSERYGKVTVEIPALTDEDAWEKGNYAPPTENAPGSQEYTSEEYGTVTVEIPAFSDTDIWTMEMNPAPSEDAPGVMEYTSERYETVTVEIPVLTNTSVWTAEMKSEPTKDTPGTMQYTSKYGMVTVDIPALSNTDIWTEKVVTEPTKEERGTLQYTSGKYGKVKVPIPALSDTDVWQPGTRIEPTETEDGSQEYISAEYGTVTVIIPSLGHEHRWSDWKSDADGHWRICGCGEKKDAAPHTFGEWITDREPSEDMPGNSHRICVECGYTENKGIVYGGVTTEIVAGENVPATNFDMARETLENILLTEEDRRQIDNGQDINFFLTVTDVGETVSEEDKAAVDSVSDGWMPGQYLDVSLFKQVGDSSYRIEETTGKLRITIEIPLHLKNEGREYAIVRVHNGETSLLRDMDESADTITIETDRFSTYSILYKDAEKPSEGGDIEDKPSEGGNDNGDKPSESGDGSQDTGAGTGADSTAALQTTTKDREPKTGDPTPIELWATLTMIGGMSYLMLFFVERRGGMTEEEKKELTSTIIRWAHRGGRLRRMLALAAIFVVLVYYHSIGKKAAVDWDAVCGE